MTSDPASRPSLSVVVPIYNAQAMLGELVDRLIDVLDHSAERSEIILVNDGSRDGSWALISELATRHERVHGIDLMRNYGQHNALLAGIRAARYAVIVTMDDDMQNPPEEIPRLLSKLSDGFDVVYGIPLKEQHGLLRDLASTATKLALQSAMGAETARHVSAFRAFRTVARDAFATYQGPFVSIDVLLTWSTNRFTAVPIRHEPRKIGKSNYTFRMLVVHALNMVTGFSPLPLQLASIVGFASSLLGLLLLVYVLARYAKQGRVVPGFAFLACVVATLSGAELFALGIMGEYLARIHFRIMDKPAYTTRQTVPN